MVSLITRFKRPLKLLSVVFALLLLGAGAIVASNPFTKYVPGYAERYGIYSTWLMLRLTTSIYLFEPRYYLTQYLALAAIDSGNVEDAKKYANALLDEADLNKKDYCFYGGAIHDAHTVLGRLALKERKIDEAIHQLLLSADAPDSPALGSFGPNLSLAEELLLAGEKQAVIDYFEKTSHFWKMQNDWLPDWKHEILTVGMLPFSDFHRMAPS